MVPLVGELLPSRATHGDHITEWGGVRFQGGESENQTLDARKGFGGCAFRAQLVELALKHEDQNVDA